MEGPIGGIVTSHVCLALRRILDEADLVPVASVQQCQFGVVHGTRNRALRNLEAVDMKDREDGTGLFGVKPFV